MPSATPRPLLAALILFLPATAAFVPHSQGHTLLQPKRPSATSPVSIRMAADAKRGVFAPVVEGAKSVLGDSHLNKLRAKVIGDHTKVITRFVNTSDTLFGRAVQRKLFDIADRDRSGALDPDEVGDALHALGFRYLTEDQCRVIFQRADADESGTVDFDEFTRETPKTLRTNLIKLAKRNGNDLGFLV